VSHIELHPGPDLALLQGSLVTLFLRPPERGANMDVLELKRECSSAVILQERLGGLSPRNPYSPESRNNIEQIVD